MSSLQRFLLYRVKIESCGFYITVLLRHLVPGLFSCPQQIHSYISVHSLLLINFRINESYRWKLWVVRFYWALFFPNLLFVKINWEALSQLQNAYTPALPLSLSEEVSISHKEVEMSSRWLSSSRPPPNNPFSVILVFLVPRPEDVGLLYSSTSYIPKKTMA